MALSKTSIRVIALTLWPIIVATCGAIWYGAHGQWTDALAALGLGTAATVTGDALHRTPPTGTVTITPASPHEVLIVAKPTSLPVFPETGPDPKISKAGIHS